MSLGIGINDDCLTISTRPVANTFRKYVDSNLNPSATKLLRHETDALDETRVQAYKGRYALDISSSDRDSFVMPL